MTIILLVFLILGKEKPDCARGEVAGITCCKFFLDQKLSIGREAAEAQKPSLPSGFLGLWEAGLTSILFAAGKLETPTVTTTLASAKGEHF